MIDNNEKETKNILSKYFRHENINSFIRQVINKNYLVKYVWI
jgi:hypothetical protein